MKKDPSLKAKSFLAFAQKISQLPETQEALRLLKNKYGLNSNLILFCCWFGIHEKRELYSSEFNQLIEKFSPWHIQIHEALKKISIQIPNDPKKPVIKMIRNMLDGILTLANQTEQAIMINGLQELGTFEEKQNSAEEGKKPLYFGLTNLFKYLRHQHVQLHQNDLEKIYRIATQSIEMSESTQ